jgi:hypothetical protein
MTLDCKHFIVSGEVSGALSVRLVSGEGAKRYVAEFRPDPASTGSFELQITRENKQIGSGPDPALSRVEDPQATVTTDPPVIGEPGDTIKACVLVGGVGRCIEPTVS